MHQRRHCTSPTFICATPLRTHSRRTSTLCTPSTAAKRYNAPRCCAATSTALSRLLEGIEKIAGAERGIFGLQEEERETIETLLQAAEAENPTGDATANNASALEGAWRLLYTDLEILGRRRVKLGIATGRKPGFIKLGTMWQTVDATNSESKNVVEFDILGGKSGKYTVWAEYKVSGKNRVEVERKKDELEPEGLRKILDDMTILREVFSPSGGLQITYCGEGVRVGRDDDGLVYVLERVEGVQI